MALIVCPECGKTFSDRAPACPECGCPTSEIAMQNGNANVGQISIANIAFEDGRYDEAYSLFAQIYAQNQNDPLVMVRLGLTAAAKEYFDRGIPVSTQELIAKAFFIQKSNSATQDELVANITPYINDVKKVIDDTNSVIVKGVSTAINQTAPTRSTGAMVADALFSPIGSANRNLYEDARTARSNAQIIQQAMANKQIIRKYLDAFGSYVLSLAADTLVDPISSDSSLYITLGAFVVSAEDAEIYKKLSASVEPQGNVYGWCFGEEKVLLSFNNNTTFLQVNGKTTNGGFAPPTGDVIVTNYKIIYNARKAKSSFIKPLSDLLRVEVGGPGTWQTHIAFVFSGGVKVLISPAPAGTQAVYVAMLKEELKMPNR